MTWPCAVTGNKVIAIPKVSGSEDFSEFQAVAPVSFSFWGRPRSANRRGMPHPTTRPGLTSTAGDPPVPTSSIFSRSDRIVNWQTCPLHPSERAENIEVHFASHVGLGVNPAALWAVADRLAQPEGEFHQFDRSGPFAIAYAPPEQAQSG